MGVCKRSRRHQLRLETLERRQMMAGDVGHNFLTPHDVNDDSRVTPLDALAVINFLNNDDRGASRGDDSTGRQRMLDVNDDSRVSPLDALQIVNNLNRSQSNPASNVAAGQIREAYFSGVGGERAKIEFEQEDGEPVLSIRLRDAAGNGSYNVFLNDLALGELMVDSRGRGELKLSQGDDRDGRGELPANFDGLSAGDHLVIEGVIDAILPDRSGSGQNGGDDRPGSNDDGRPGGQGNDDRTNPLELVATFSQSAGLLPEAEFEIDLRRGVAVREFEVEVERGVPGQSLLVTIDGVEVGMLTPNARGKAKLKLSSVPRDADELQMPANFPSVVENSVIRIGAAEGRFRRLVGNV